MELSPFTADDGEGSKKGQGVGLRRGGPGAGHLGQSCPVLLHSPRVLRGPWEHLEVPLPLSEEWRR